MGTLTYGGATAYEIDDRTLAHLKLVITTKLRRNESFTLTCQRSDHDAEQRTALWLQPAIPLRFEFGTAEGDALDPDLLQEFAEAATTNAGIIVDTSPVAQTAALIAA